MNEEIISKSLLLLEDKMRRLETVIIKLESQIKELLNERSKSND